MGDEIVVRRPTLETMRSIIMRTGPLFLEADVWFLKLAAAFDG